MNDIIEPTQTVELEGNSKQLLENTESTVHSTYEDVQEIGNQVDYSKMTLEQLRDEVRKLRKENEYFRLQVRKLVADEIEKQIKPLVDQLNLLTKQNPRFVYVKFKFPLLDFIKKRCAILLALCLQAPTHLIKKIW